MYDIEQKKSNNRKNFKQLYIMIKVKSWRRAISTRATKWHIQAYFDKFYFRINCFQFKTSIFHKTIKRMLESKPIYQHQIERMLNV